MCSLLQREKLFFFLKRLCRMKQNVNIYRIHQQMLVRLLHYLAYREVNKSTMENGRSERIISIKVLHLWAAVLACIMLYQGDSYVLNHMLHVSGIRGDA